MSDKSHSALVVPTLDSYVASCSCGWIGGSHDQAGDAEQEAREHVDNPTLAVNGFGDPHALGSRDE